jgi:hypothetical protein
MKLNNTRQVRAEDFDAEYEQLTSQLGAILNSFMQEVVELSDNRVDFENKVENIRDFEITLGESGVPINEFNINLNKSNIRGIEVVRVINSTNPNALLTGGPFVSWTPIGGSSVRIDQITGLLPNNRYILTIITY